MELLYSVFLSFLSGGTLCLIAEILINKTKLTTARIMVLYVSLGVFLYATGVYTPLLDIFGCGASLPLIGFGGAIGKGVATAIEEEGIIGIFSGGLSATSVGITVALLSGLLISLVARSKPRRM